MMNVVLLILLCGLKNSAAQSGREASESCAGNWEPTSLISAQNCHSANTQEIPSVNGAGQEIPSGPHPCNHTVDVNLLTCHERYRRGFRLGPISSTRGNWHSLTTSSLQGTLLYPGESIVAYSAQTRDLSGHFIGYPPLHVHHIHINKQNSGSSGGMGGNSVSVVFATHGDASEVSEAETRGYGRQLPAGYCVPIDAAQMWMASLVNDVRVPAASGAEESLDFFLEIMFTLSESPRACKPTAFLFGMTPPLPLIPTDMFGRFYVANTAAVGVWDGTMPFSGHTLRHSIWYHTHLRFQALLLLRGSLRGVPCELLGLRDSELGLLLPKPDLATVRSTLKRSGSVVCEAWVDTPAGQAMGTPDGPSQDRQTSMECSEWRFSRGEPYTIVALIEPLNNTRAEDHIDLFMYVDQDTSAFSPQVADLMLTPRLFRCEDSEASDMIGGMGHGMGGGMGGPTDAAASMVQEVEILPSSHEAAGAMLLQLVLPLLVVVYLLLHTSSRAAARLLML